jgi:DNA-binding IclR family transcriptional regulator
MAQSVDRSIALIERAAAGPLTLGEAASHLGVHKSTALRILQALESRRFVRRTVAGSYVVGPGIIEIAQEALSSIDLRQVGAAPLRELQRATGNTVHLGQLIGDEVIYVDKVDSPTVDAVQINSRIGRAVSLYTSGVGKVILAYRSPAERERLLGHVDLVQHTPTTFATPELLAGELSRILDRGWATDDGELNPLVNCIAAPIRDSNGEVTAAVSVTAMKALVPLPQLMAHLPALLETTALISREMGYSPVGA